jgi:hypothetical protein
MASVKVKGVVEIQNFVNLYPFEMIAASGIIKFLLKELMNKAS